MAASPDEPPRLDNMDELCLLVIASTGMKGHTMHRRRDILREPASDHPMILQQACSIAFIHAIIERAVRARS